MTAWQIYWLTRCEAVGRAAGWIVTVLFIAMIVACGFTVLVMQDARDQEEAKEQWSFFKPILFRIGFGFAVSLLTFILVPSNKDIALIFAGSWATKSAEMQRLPDNVLQVVNKYLEGYLEPEEKK